MAHRPAAYLLLCSGAAMATPAAAHVVLAQPQATSGGYYAGFFRVSHGCKGSPTVTLRIEIPEAVISAKPQPKPGWSHSVERTPLAEPRPSESGPVTHRVTAITWRGRLDDAEFDQFGVMMRLPNQSEPLYFPVIQTCETGERRWTEVPRSGQSRHELESPAAMLELTPAVGAAGPHRH
jgi:hypothetical protein